MKPRSQGLWSPALAAAGLGVLASPDVRQLLEARMSLHMALQLPALAACGALLVGPTRQALSRRTAVFNQQGVPGFLFVLFVMALWMLPRSLDAVLTSGTLEACKFLSVALAGAVALVSWQHSSAVTQGFVVGNTAWMLCAAGLMVQDARTRLCTAYLIEDQVWAGRSLIGWGLGLALVWGFVAWRHAMRRHRAIEHLPGGRAAPPSHARPRDA